MHCQPEKEISDDERMVRSKARFSFKNNTFATNLQSEDSSCGVCAIQATATLSGQF